MSKEDRSLRFPEAILYSDTTLKFPIHSFRASSFRLWGQSGNAVNLCVDGAWIKMDDVDPVLTEYSFVNTPPMKWHAVLGSQTDIKQQAFETLKNEQDEIKNRTPILNRTLTICDTMDLYHSYGEILDARWLPSNRFYKNQSPQGIKLNHDTELWIRNNKLEYLGKPLSIGDTINTTSGDASYKYIIRNYTVANSNVNQLKELKIQYIVVMIPKREKY
jgi:hypothetical protein